MGVSSTVSSEENATSTWPTQTTEVQTLSPRSLTSHAAVIWFRVMSPIFIALTTVGNPLSIITLQNPLFRSNVDVCSRSSMPGTGSATGTGSTLKLSPTYRDLIIHMTRSHRFTCPDFVISSVQISLFHLSAVLIPGCPHRCSVLTSDVVCHDPRVSSPVDQTDFVSQNPLFRKSSTSFILSVLAVVDAGVIYTGLLRFWIESLFSVDLRLMSSTACKIHIHLTYFFRQVFLTSLDFFSVLY